MRRVTIFAVIIAVVLLAGGAFMVLGTTDLFGGNTGPSDGLDSLNGTVNAPFPVETPADAPMALNLAYPGKGNSSFVQDRNVYTKLSLSAVPVPGHSGKVLTKVYVEKANGTVAGAVLIKRSSGDMIDLSLNQGGGKGYDVLSGDLSSWKSDGTAVVLSFEVLFFLSGEYNVTVQAFDLDSGKAIAAPVTASLLIGSST